MKNIIIVIILLSALATFLFGCTTYGKRDSETKQALLTLTGGVVGMLLAGNAGGAIVGAFATDIFSLATIKYNDKQLEDGKEAAKRYQDNKKVEKKEDDKKVGLYIEESSIAAQNVKIGSTIEANVQYTLLSHFDEQEIKITETRILSTGDKRVELSKREVMRTPGTYISTIRFTMPDYIPKGSYILFTTISSVKHSRTARSVLNII